MKNSSNFILFASFERWFCVYARAADRRDSSDSPSAQTSYRTDRTLSSGLDRAHANASSNRTNWWMLSRKSYTDSSVRWYVIECAPSMRSTDCTSSGTWCIWTVALWCGCANVSDSCRPAQMTWSNIRTCTDAHWHAIADGRPDSICGRTFSCTLGTHAFAYMCPDRCCWRLVPVWWPQTVLFSPTENWPHPMVRPSPIRPIAGRIRRRSLNPPIRLDALRRSPTIPPIHNIHFHRRNRLVRKWFRSIRFPQVERRWPYSRAHYLFRTTKLFCTLQPCYFHPRPEHFLFAPHRALEREFCRQIVFSCDMECTLSSKCHRRMGSANEKPQIKSFCENKKCSRFELSKQFNRMWRNKSKCFIYLSSSRLFDRLSFDRFAFKSKHTFSSP